MLQTERKSDPARKTTQNRNQTEESRRQSSEIKNPASLALQAILAGGSWDQLPADGILALSHTMGNGALLDMYALHRTGPETAMYPAARDGGAAAPIEWSGGAPALTEAPAFGSLGVLGTTAPLNI
jgi:hypothetical protein